MKGQWVEADQAAQQATVIGASDHLVALTRIASVLLAVHRGDATEAERQLAGMTPLADSDHMEARASWQLAQALVAELGDQPSLALPTATEAVRAAFRDEGFPADVFRQGWPLALEVAINDGHFEEASELLSIVADAPKGHVPPYLRSQLARYTARLNARRGHHETVKQDFRRAAAILTELGYPFWLAQTQTDYARWLIEQGSSDEAERLFTEAEDTFERLGAKPHLDRLRAARATAVA